MVGAIIFGLLFALAAAGNIYANIRELKNLAFITKLVLIPLLIVFALFAGNPANALVIIGLVLSYAGEIMFMIKTDRTFLFGMGGFLLAIIFYCIAFIGGIGWITFSSFFFPLIIILLLYALAYLTLRSMIPYELRLPSLCYIIAHGLVTFLAFNVMISGGGFPGFMLFLGTVLFSASGYLQIRVRFGREFRWQNMILTGTYILAQLFITLWMVCK